MARFPKNEIISLIGTAPRYDLGESVGPDLRLSDLLDASGQQTLGEMALGYGTAEGDPRLRKVIAEAHGVTPDDVVVTVGGMHALFLIAFILCERGDEAVTTSPLFPLARNALDVVGANVRTLRLSFDRGYQRDLTDLRQLLSEKTKLLSGVHPYGETQKLGTGCDGTRRGLRRSGLRPRLLVWLGGASRERARPP